ncbi:unnamed protein product [Didymodactylos carnosus]|uniref:EF-hand domain-containing protein n=1 Tax=Didymodactylos carnosus TaxID=1234261 RepID=A0A8S2F655_9BILA|nr:unnamed protein product [Didymodactylos carnosus]CAF4169810.1 unnamed protein product [Didymodactylos carnosus]
MRRERRNPNVVSLKVSSFTPHAIYDLNGESKTGPNAPEKKVEQIFAKMDKNRDYKLSKDEFVNGCLTDPHLLQLLSPSVVS